VNRALIVALSVVFFAAACGAVDKASVQSESRQNSAQASLLEGKIRKAWDDYKKRDKQSFSTILAPGFGEVTNDAEGIFGKDTELSEMDQFHLAKYELKDFHSRAAGRDAVVMTYTAEYSGTYANSPIQMKAVYGEVWVKSGSDWKLLWVQETKIK
jgi:hypothetical protein